MQKTRLLVVLATVLMLVHSACASTTTEPTPTPAPTNTVEPTDTPTPTETPTPIPVSAVTIHSKVISPAILRLEFADFQSSNPGVFPLQDVPDGDKHFSWQLTNRNGVFKGWISVFLFESPSDMSRAYSIAEENVEAYRKSVTADLGDECVVYEGTREGTRWTGVIYTSGRALVSVFLTGYKPEAIVSYAESFDRRLQPAVAGRRSNVPAPIKPPPSSPSSPSPFERCVQSGEGVRYVITGTGVDAVSLTWQNDTSGIEQGDYKLPFCLPYSNFKSGDFLYISAQITKPTSGAGNIWVRIYDGNSIIAEARASDFASIASCDGAKR